MTGLGAHSREGPAGPKEESLAWIFGQLRIWPGGGVIGSIIVAFVGAVIVVGITRLLKRA